MLISLDALKVDLLGIRALHDNANGVNNDSPRLLLHNKCWFSLFIKSTQLHDVWMHILQIQVESNLKCFSKVFSKLEKRRLFDPKTNLESKQMCRTVKNYLSFNCNFKVSQFFLVNALISGSVNTTLVHSQVSRISCLLSS